MGGHAKDCDYHCEQFPPDCTCGRTEAERRVAKVRGSYDAPGFEACVQAELAEMKKGESNG